MVTAQYIGSFPKYYKHGEVGPNSCLLRCSQGETVEGALDRLLGDVDAPDDVDADDITAAIRGELEMIRFTNTGGRGGEPFVHIILRW